MRDAIYTNCLEFVPIILSGGYYFYRDVLLYPYFISVTTGRIDPITPECLEADGSTKSNFRNTV